MLYVKFAYPSCLQHTSIISKNMILEVARSIILNLRQNRQHLFENISKIKLNKENVNIISVMTLIINSYNSIHLYDFFFFNEINFLNANP